MTMRPTGFSSGTGIKLELSGKGAARRGRIAPRCKTRMIQTMSYQSLSPQNLLGPLNKVEQKNAPTARQLGFDTPRNETLARHLGEADPQVHAPHGHRVRRRRRGRPMGPGC